MVFNDQAVVEHTLDVMYGPLSGPEPGCVMCQRASELGLWDGPAGDPFAPAAQEDDR